VQRHRGKAKDIARNAARVKENGRGGSNIKGKKNVYGRACVVSLTLSM
jgi:hypothetical protein